ncbi:DUF397 domain-containing protein [Streptomyces sp. NPDC058067]|uniref:DUF397 domain-containing protein n=1 Tax=Streptomyces sp. NPDC058067 TaxID=3346324 RepID=UPI0036E4361D
MDLSKAKWRTSSYSNGDGGYCVEIATGPALQGTGLVPVRDSKLADSPVLLLQAPTWSAFMTHLKRR